MCQVICRLPLFPLDVSRGVRCARADLHVSGVITEEFVVVPFVQVGHEGLGRGRVVSLLSAPGRFHQLEEEREERVLPSV